LKIKLLLLIFLVTTSNLSATPKPKAAAITVMTLNIYGWKTMPKHSDDYAQLVNRNNVDFLGIQEGVEDWQLNTKLPTNYHRAATLEKSLGQCWQRQYQIFINRCHGNRFVKFDRFDLSDGPNATRTGEYAVIEKQGNRYLLVNVHWDHESIATRILNAKETAMHLNKFSQYPKILLGDFNSDCQGKTASMLQSTTKMVLLKGAGIDCILVKGLTGKANEIAAYPSDHPSIVATLIKENVNSMTSH